MPVPDPLPILFGRIVRRRREASGQSQEEVAAKTNLSRNYVGMVERGETNPTLLVLRGLADALGTSMSELIVELETMSEAGPTAERGQDGV